MGTRRRLEAVEGRLRARASPVGPRSPEQEAERERRFGELFREMGFAYPPPPRDPEQAREDLFAEIERHREEIDRKAGA